MSLPFRPHILVLFLLFLPTARLKAQSFANGGFENMSGCPPFFGPDEQIGDVMEDWYAVQGTPDGYHTDCPPFHPDSTPGLPSPFLGSGFAGLWGTGEVIGQTLAFPLLHEKTYCISFTGQALDLAATGLMEGDPCLELCIYGSMIAPPPVTPISIPVPVETMPGTVLLGCSDPLPLGSWGEGEIQFATDAAYEHLFLASLQDPSCNSAAPYLAFDEITLMECIATSIGDMGFTGLGNGLDAFRSDPAIQEIRIIDMGGRVVRSINASSSGTGHHPGPGYYLLQGLDRNGRIVRTGRVSIAGQD